MSFTEEIQQNLLLLPLKKPCCRKAFLLGLWVGACPDGEGGWTTTYPSKAVAECCAELLGKLFHISGELSIHTRAGRSFYSLSCRRSGPDLFLRTLEQEPHLPIHEAAGFRCAACRSAFLRGVFLATGTVTDPQKSYHMELALPTEGRADLLREFMSVGLARPGKVKRGARFGLYYKSNGAIGDFLYSIGGTEFGFRFYNLIVERDIRNHENRATNCVAHNIARSVDASKKHREAIERLYATRRIDTLGEELRVTAKLRMENPAASLCELARLHQPPISKSGLNRRLCRLLEEAEELSKT